MVSSHTLQEVADRAGVSIGTASSALNNRPSVSPDTRMRVLDAAISLGYPLKTEDIPFAETGMKVIGLLLKHDYGSKWLVNPFYSRIQLGVANACTRNKLSLMFSNIEVDISNRPYSWPVMLNDKQIDGLILAGTFTDDTISSIQHRLDIPMVLVDSFSTTLSCDSIITDNWGGGRQAIQHLLSYGHRHIAMIGWNHESPLSVKGRHQAYLNIMEENGLSPIVLESYLTREDGFKAAGELMRKYPEVTAVFGCNDETAIGVIEGLRAVGKRIPDDVSVVGFDNIDLAQEIDPPLTTIHVHKSWMGTMGVSTLLERAQNPQQPKLTKVVSTHLVARGTVCQARKTSDSP